MDRILVYPGNIPLDTDILNTNRNSMVALGYLAQAILGTGTSCRWTCMLADGARLADGDRWAPAASPSCRSSTRSPMDRCRPTRSIRW